MDNAVEDKLKILKLAYAAQLPSKVNEIVEGWKSLSEKFDEAQLDLFLRNVHKLTGTAGTYGYSGVSEISGKIENYSRRLQTAQDIKNARSVIDDYIEELKQIIIKPPSVDSSANIKIPTFDENKVRVVYFLDKDKKKLLSQIDQLSQFNYKVNIFEDIPSFIKATQTDKPDMVIVDVDLAEQIPPEIIKKFREELILFLYTSDKDELTPRLIAVRQGGQAFITKPFEMGTLLRTMDNLFEARQSHHERILIVDDSESLAAYYSTLLEQSGMVTQKVIDPTEFLNTLQEFQPDLILMDINMPFCSGVELAQIVLQQETLSAVPIVYLSTIAERARQIELLSLAGDDFLTKPVDPKHLITAVRNRLMRSRIVRSRVMRDSLTNLFNHTMIHHQLEREITVAARYKHEVSVVLFDIDHFKSVNDTYGHQAGDKILKDLSLFLHNHLRKSDLIGRYGGEEFLVVLPNTSPKEAMRIIDKIREQFSHQPHQVDDKELFITVSGGISSYPQIKDPSGLVKAADEALYKAKESGRNRIISA